ncbi:MAG TPA: ATP-binding protein [Thermoanaerobaculia bacterium]|nr:ATP-binding protein [Thermoanaerobaculia bacterium]
MSEERNRTGHRSSPAPAPDWTSEMLEWIESGAAYRQFIDSVQDYACLVLDPEGQVASWNRGAERIFGYQAAEILGRTCVLFFTPEDVRDGVPAQELATAAAKGRASDDRWQMRKNGSRFFANGVTISLRSPDGALRGFGKILRDYTEEKLSEERLRDRATILAEADRHRNEFLAVLAHELRNPLAPILNSLRILGRQEREGGPRQERAREIIERQVRQLSRLIDDLLDVSRITSGRIGLRKEPVDLRTILEHAVQTARPLIDARRHHLAVSYPAEPVWLAADPTRLEQVVANLLNNAAKYTEDGGSLALTVETRGGEVRVRVRDSGIGIAPDLLDNIFDPFVQGSRSLDRSEGGLGIGLTLVRKLVELHDGTIEAWSEGIGKGSELIVTLPAIQPDIQSAIQTGSRPEPKAPPEDGAAPLPLRVLVVDDNLDTAESLRLLLEMAGHEIRTAHSGPEALEAAAAFSPDAILLDIGLPGLNGFEVARRLRQDPLLGTAALFAVSGYGQEEDRQRSREAGFDRHLLKPLDFEEIQNLLAAVVARGPRPER